MATLPTTATMALFGVTSWHVLPCLSAALPPRLDWPAPTAAVVAGVPPPPPPSPALSDVTPNVPRRLVSPSTPRSSSPYLDSTPPFPMPPSPRISPPQSTRFICLLAMSSPLLLRLLSTLPLSLSIWSTSLSSLTSLALSSLGFVGLPPPSVPLCPLAVVSAGNGRLTFPASDPPMTGQSALQWSSTDFRKCLHRSTPPYAAWLSAPCLTFPKATAPPPFMAGPASAMSPLTTACSSGAFRFPASGPSPPALLPPQWTCSGVPVMTSSPPSPSIASATGAPPGPRGRLLFPRGLPLPTISSPCLPGALPPPLWMSV